MTSCKKWTPKSRCLSSLSSTSNNLSITSKLWNHVKWPLVFLSEDFGKNSNTPNGGAECRWGRLKLATFDKLLANSKTSTIATVVNFVRSQVYHTFAVMQCVAWVRQWQLILVKFNILWWCSLAAQRKSWTRMHIPVSNAIVFLGDCLYK